MAWQMGLNPFLARVLEAEGLILEPVSAVLALLLLLQLALGDLGRWRMGPGACCFGWVLGWPWAAWPD